MLDGELDVREEMERDLAKRASPILADGTPLRDLIDLERREVAMRVLNDPEIHRLELAKVFTRSWHVVGHVSEIPNAGDFVQRTIAQDKVIVTRGRDGAINVLLNACAHRGMEICWADEGNQSSFKCPYHGWVFDPTGRLMGAPFEREMYGDWDKGQYGLRTARVGVRCGVIFATFGEDAPAFDDYMGDIGWYFDQMFGQVELEALGSPTMSLIRANWKISSDNNSGDGYHTPSLHKSLQDIGLHAAGENSAKAWALDGCYDVSTPQGHGLRCVESAQAVFKGEIANKQDNPFDGWFLAGNLFPVNGVHSTPFPTASDTSRILQTADIAVVLPQGPGAYVVWRLPLVEKGASEAARTEMISKFATQVTLTQTDDFVGFQRIQKTAEGHVGSELRMKYNSLLGVRKPDGWPGPGLVYAGFSKDDNQWWFWLRWYDMMTS